MIKGLLTIQKQLDDHINEERNIQGEKLEELYIALLVEISECINNWNLFKFWKANPEPKTKDLRKVVTSKSGGIEAFHHVEYNPLLEEYVDGLKFMLCIANKIEFNPEEVVLPPKRVKKGSYEVTLQKFGFMYGAVTNYRNNIFFYTWEAILSEYLLLGALLGFSNNEIIDAFHEKTRTNYERIANGY